VTFAVALMAWPAPQAAKPTPYQKWVNEDVVYIITAEEKQAFAGLKTDEEREKFISQFWDRRNPVPGAAKNQFREEHYRRIAYVNDRYKGAAPGWKTDRGRIYITYGPPDEIESHPSGGKYTRPPNEGGGDTVTYPFEQWRYRLIEGVGKNIIIEFVDKSGTGDYRMTTDPHAREQEQARVLGGQVPGLGAVLLWQSEGPGQRASVALSNGQMAVTVPIEFAAKGYVLGLTTKRGEEKVTSWSKTLFACATAPWEESCVREKFVTEGPLSLGPGRYTLTAQVKGLDGSGEKSYTVKFKVN
jgi:GWxTD domain-containing protein